MEVLELRINVEELWFNFVQLKESYNLALPFDTFEYDCACGDNISIFPTGSFCFEGCFSSFQSLINEEKQRMIEQHKDEKKCFETIKLKPGTGVPDNLLFLVRHAQYNDIQPIIAENEVFSPVLVVLKDSVPALVLFQNASCIKDTYLKFIKNNFSSHLDVPNLQKVSIEDIDNEEELHSFQQNLPRLTGGGRKMLQEFKYICQWCSHDTLKKKTRGRFMEIKNYRDHFRKYHSDKPFSEFLNKVERDEPKWQCKICRQRLSLGNQLRHQIICRPPNFGDSSSEDDEEASRSGSSDKNIPDLRSSNATPNEGTSNESSDGEIAPRKLIRKRPISSSESSQERTDEKQEQVCSNSQTQMEDEDSHQSSIN